MEKLYILWHIIFVNPLTPRSDKHETSPYNIPYIIQQTGNENVQSYQVEAAILIEHQVLITNLQGNV